MNNDEPQPQNEAEIVPEATESPAESLESQSNDTIAKPTGNGNLSQIFEKKRNELLEKIESMDSGEDSNHNKSGKKAIQEVLKELEKGGFPKRHIKRLGKGPLTGPGRDKAEELKPKILTGDCIILLLGNRGPGKTQIATWWAAVRSFKNKSCGTYCKLVDLLGDIKTTWAKAAKTNEQELLERYRRTKYLVIDEVQELSGKEWEDRVLTNILDHRYDDMLVTVLIANVNPVDAKKVFGPSILDRATETGGLVFCDWESYRKNAN